MGNRFSTASVNSFLVEQGCDADRANFISTFVVTALRSVSVHASIAAQSAAPDFTSYHVEVAANDGEGFIVDYSVNKVGAGFFDHRAKVTTPHSEYTVTRLIHEPLADAPVETTPAVVEEFETVTEETPVVVEEVATEETPVAAAPVEAEVEVHVEVDAQIALEDTATEAVAEAVEETPAVEAEAPKAKKGKAKKKAD